MFATELLEYLLVFVQSALLRALHVGAGAVSCVSLSLVSCLLTLTWSSPSLPSDAAGLCKGTQGGGAACPCISVHPHRAHRRGLREPVPGEEVPAHRHGVVGTDVFQVLL